jgi:hypothetical protein
MSIDDLRYFAKRAADERRAAAAAAHPAAAAAHQELADRYHAFLCAAAHSLHRARFM